MSLSPEQIQGLEVLVQQFTALQESIPKQFEQISDSLNNLEGRIRNAEVTFHEALNREITTVTQECQRLVNALNTNIRNYIDNNRLDSTPATSTNQQSHVINNNANLGSSVRLRNPTTFNGGSAELCDDFFAALSVNFASSPSSFPNDESKVLYAINNMSGTALKYLPPYRRLLNFNDKPETLTNFSVFETTITSAFGHSNPVFNADNAIRQLRHTSTVAAYATEFRSLATRLKWNDDALMSQYNTGKK